MANQHPRDPGNDEERRPSWISSLSISRRDAKATQFTFLVNCVAFVIDHVMINVTAVQTVARYPHVYTLRVVQCDSCKGFPL